MSIRFYCQVCGDHQEVDIEPLERKGPNPDPWGDVVCKACHFVIATASADSEGTLEFRPAEAVRKLATDIVRDIWISNQRKKPKTPGLNGAMSAFLRSNSDMSFDEFLAKLKNRDGTLYLIRGLGRNGVEVLRRHFRNEAAPLD